MGPLPTVNPTIDRYEISGGQTGIRQTVGMLEALAIRASMDPAVIRTAREIVAYAPENDVQAEITMLDRYVRNHVRYTGDPGGLAGAPDSGAELVTDPVFLVQDIESGRQAYGDCDDMVTLLASLAMAVGHDARFVTRSQESSGPHGHVYLEILDRNSGQWWPMDPIVRPNFVESFRGRVVPGARQTERFPEMRGGMGMVAFRNPGLAYGGNRFPTSRTVTVAGVKRLHGIFDDALTSLVNALPDLAKSGVSYYTAQQQMDLQKELADKANEVEMAKLALQQQLATQTQPSEAKSAFAGALGGIDQKTLLLVGGGLLLFFMLKGKK